MADWGSTGVLYDVEFFSTVVSPLFVAPPPPPVGGQRIANLHSGLGQYYVAFGDGVGIVIFRADGPVPRASAGPFSPWDWSGYAVTDAAATNPALVEDHRPAVILLYESAGSVLSATSFDRGVTWSDPVSELPGILPAATRGMHGQIVRAAVQGDGTLLATVQYPGDRWPNDNYTGSTQGTSSDAAYTLLDDAAAPLVTDGTGVALSAAPDGRIIMALIAFGESDHSHWWSGDRWAQYWQRVT